jgi:hypothetical protein
MTTITVPDAQIIKLAKGRFGTIDVDTTRFPEHVQLYIYEYGLRQTLNDAMAEKTEPVLDADRKPVIGNNGKPLKRELPYDVIRDMSVKRLENLYAGVLRMRRASTEPDDPIEAEAYKIARDNMLAVYKKMAVWHQVPKGTKNRFAAVIHLRLAENNMEPIDDDDEAVEYAIERYLDQNPDIRVKAARNVQEREEMVASLADGIV